MTLFRSWGEFVVRRPIPVLVAVLLVTGLLGSQAAHLRLDIREKDQLPQDHPYTRLYTRINDQFGGGAITLIGIVATQGDVFNRDTLSKVERITSKVEGLPTTARGTVLSLASARVKSVADTGGGVEVRALMPRVPESEDEIRRLRSDVLADDLYRGTLVSADGTATAVVIEVPVDASYPTFHRDLEAIVAPERDARTQIVMAGGPVVLDYLNQYTAQVAVLFPIAVLVIGLVHYEAFRTFQAMLLPLATALLSVVWALGVMGSFRAPLDTWSAIAPVAILAVAAGHAVQILKRYYEEYAATADSRSAIVESIASLGPVMVTACLIASAGFASLATFQVNSVRVFGLLMACGILSALVIEMTFIPACRALLPAPKRREAVRERESRWLSPALGMLAEQVVTRPWGVLVVTGLVAGIFLSGASLVRVDGGLRGYFSPASRMRQEDAVINERFVGASILKVLIEGQEPGALERPDVLRAVEDLQRFLMRSPEIGKTLSVVDYVKKMHRAMDPVGARSAPIPDDQNLIGQYLFLYSMSQPDDLTGLVDPTYKDGVVVAFSKADNAAFVHALLADLERFAEPRFAGLPVSVGIAGGMLGANAALNDVIVREKLRNMVQVALIIFVLSAVAFRSLAGGLLVFTPLAIAAIVNFGVMGWTRIPLSMSTAAVTAMGVSIGADFAIYLIFRLREELAVHELGESVRRTLLTSGKSVLFVSSAVSLGCAVLMFSGFAAWKHLGGLTALVMAVSSLAAISVVPALVMIFRPRFLWAASSRVDRRSPTLDSHVGDL